MGILLYYYFSGGCRIGRSRPESARNRIRKACGKEKAAVEFLVGGTQTNAVMIDALLKSYQGVIAAETGHISVHEAGAIEANGHKVLAIPHHYGKISASAVENIWMIIIMMRTTNIW